RGSISPVYFQDFENTICDALNLMRIWPRLREVLMKTGNVVPNYACEKEIKSWLAWQNNEAKVSALNSITKLDLSNLNLKRLPAFFCSLTFANLTELNLAQNQIENVPEGAFGNCPKLMLIKFSNT